MKTHHFRMLAIAAGITLLTTALVVAQPAVDKPAPAAEFTYNGKKVKLSDYKGQVVYLKFTATWCGPCKAMAPTQAALAKRLKDAPFTVLEVDIDENRGTTAAWKVNAVPMIYVIDHEGVVRKSMLGGQSAKALDDAIDPLVKLVPKKNTK